MSATPRLIILTDNALEPIARAALELQCVETHLVTLERFMKSAIVSDRISGSEVKIRWEFRDGPKILQITNQADAILMNRILEYPDRLFENFAEEDRFYAKRELQAYFGFATSHFRGIGFAPHPMGYGHHFQSLPRQWASVRRVGGIAVPRFRWEHNLKCPDNDRWVESTIFNYFRWKPSPHTPELEPKPDRPLSGVRFAFERPSGEPVLAQGIGKQIFVFDRFMKPVEASLSAKVESALSSIRHTGLLGEFHETLFFSQGDSLCFGATHGAFTAGADPLTLAKPLERLLLARVPELSAGAQKGATPC